MKVRKLLPFFLITLVYVGVVVAEGHDPSPPAFTAARFLFEARHTLAHLATFGLEAWLVARAVDLPRDRSWHILAGLIGVGVALGSGIEILQVSRRMDYDLWGGLWDIITDGIGAGLGCFIYWRRMSGATEPTVPGSEVSSNPERTVKAP
jgi:hypothetical protein